MKRILLFMLCVVVPSIVEARGNRDAPAKTREALDRVILPVVDFKEMTLGQCLDVIRSRAVELDASELNPKLKGFKIYKIAEELEDLEIRYLRRNVKVTEVLKELARQAALDLHLTSVGVVFSRPNTDPFSAVEGTKGEIWETLYSHKARGPSRTN